MRMIGHLRECGETSVTTSRTGEEVVIVSASQQQVFVSLPPTPDNGEGRWYGNIEEAWWIVPSVSWCLGLLPPHRSQIPLLLPCLLL